ncbi:DUF2207 domain-containing protein [Bifidobacterium sp. ESL0800]|uniref:DUF2207 domain-containing protein n=1 Tax=Bifidobacterium sp. ESL0800 TaxID=2983236 RepID=UPI0023F73BE2|nr:DUF2207 domain-containing protein [Bifidobacterium sp. ESL0800]WEV75124.1 DUF2207 domain-containing protein [Bifidobacterium sp. ESL0800]
MGRRVVMGEVYSLKRLGKAALVALVVVVVVVGFYGFCAWQGSGSGNQMSYNSLDDDAVVMSNGDLRITQHIDVKLGKRKGGDNGAKPWRELFQRYRLADAPGKAADEIEDDEDTLSAITDVSVKNVTTGQTYRHGDADSPNALHSSRWDATQAGTWYARNLGPDANVDDDKPGVDYRPAAMSSAKYDVKKQQDDMAKRQQRQQILQGQTQSRQQTQAGGDKNTDTNADSDTTDSGTDSDAGSDTKYSSRDWYPGTKPSEMGAARDVIEIGWNIPTTTSAESMKFDVTMTFKDVVKVYNDVAYMKWEPVADDNGVPIGRFHAKVSLPQGTKAGTMRQWMDYPGKGTIRRAGQRSIEMSAEHVPARNHIDLVSMFGHHGMGQVRYRVHRAAKEDVVSWMEYERMNSVKNSGDTRFVLLKYIALPVILALAVGIAAVIASNRKAWIRGDVDYVRDIPSITPGVAADLMDDLMPDDVGDASLASRQTASTLLELASKKRIAVYPGKADWYSGLDLAAPAADVSKQAGTCLDQALGRGKKADTVTIAVLPKSSRAAGKGRKLSKSEKSLLTMLMDISTKLGSPTFDLSQVNDRLGDWEKGAKAQDRFFTSVDTEYASGEYSKHFVFSYVAAAVLVVVGALESLIIDGLAFSELGSGTDDYGAVCDQFHGQWGLSLILGVPVIFVFAFLFRLLKFKVLTPAGRQTGTQLLGLRRYMEDFSDFSERDVPDLALWDQYLVYATAFGISGKVTKRMAQVFPNLTDSSWLDGNAGDSLLYWSYYPSVDGVGDGNGAAGADAGQALSGVDSFGGLGDFGSQIASGFDTLQSTFADSFSDSDGGSGGGFSGGGSFGGSGGGSGGGSFGGR